MEQVKPTLNKLMIINPSAAPVVPGNFPPGTNSSFQYSHTQLPFKHYLIFTPDREMLVWLRCPVGGSKVPSNVYAAEVNTMSEAHDLRAGHSPVLSLSY